MSCEHTYNYPAAESLTALADFLATHHPEGAWTIDTASNGETFVRNDYRNLLFITPGDRIVADRGKFTVHPQ